MKQAEKCTDCARNWMTKDKITAQELTYAIEDCKVCKRNNFILYIKSTGGGTAGKEKQ